MTRLLSAWADGDTHALEQLMPLVYNELHRIARHHWARQPEGHTLQPTALIHEAFLKFVHRGDKPIVDRVHFFALASTAMRQVLVNHAEASLAKKRGGGEAHVPLENANPAVEKEAEEVLALNAALASLNVVDARKSRVVELRYFGGLSVDEIAQMLGVSSVTVKRDWQTARAWLARELGPSKPIHL
ncbi:MAG: ECF-type sigma factor [Acidobacteria bacterium]|nr:ECF-type sigma factor [Acidobacteriota bacterium]